MPIKTNLELWLLLSACEEALTPWDKGLSRANLDFLKSALIEVSLIPDLDDENRAKAREIAKSMRVYEQALLMSSSAL